MGSISFDEFVTELGLLVGMAAGARDAVLNAAYNNARDIARALRMLMFQYDVYKVAERHTRAIHGASNP